VFPQSVHRLTLPIQVKERLLLPITALIPQSIHPNTLTLSGFLIGLFIPFFSSTSHPYLALLAWGLNRLIDGLDGTIARQRGMQSAWGGYVDIVCDFTVRRGISCSNLLRPFRSVTHRVTQFYCSVELMCKKVYSLIPIGIAFSPSSPPSSSTILPLSLLLSSFHVNNVILFYLSSALPPSSSTELTSLRMVPAIIEGTESLIFLTLMIAFPGWFVVMSWVMACLVGLNIIQRSLLARSALQEVEGERERKKGS